MRRGGQAKGCGARTGSSVASALSCIARHSRSTSDSSRAKASGRCAALWGLPGAIGGDRGRSARIGQMTTPRRAHGEIVGRSAPRSAHQPHRQLPGRAAAARARERTRQRGVLLGGDCGRDSHGGRGGAQGDQAGDRREIGRDHLLLLALRLAERAPWRARDARPARPPRARLRRAAGARIDGPRVDEQEGTDLWELGS